MALVNINVGVLKIDNDSATLTDISAGVEDVTLAGTKNTGQYNVLNSVHMKTSEGARAHTLSGNCIRTDGASDAYALLADWWDEGGLRTVEVYDPDETTGSYKWTGEARLESFTPVAKNASSGDPGKHAFNIIFDGMTQTIVAA